MGENVYRKSFFSSLTAFLSPLLVTAAVIALVLYGLRETENAGRAEGRRLLEEGIRAAVLQCYVAEGSYPESLEYMEQRYGLFIDRSKYAVHYEIIASNMGPDITVLELNGEQGG